MYLKRLLCKFDIADRKVWSILRSLKSMGESWTALFFDGTHKTHSEVWKHVMPDEIQYWMRKLFVLLGAIFFGLRRPLQSYDITMLWCSNLVVRASDSDLRKRDCSRGTIALSGGPAVSPTVTRRGLCVLEWNRHQLQVGWWGDLQSREGSMKTRGDADCFFLRIARTEGI